MIPPTVPVSLALENDYELVVSGLSHMLAPYWHRVSLVEFSVQGVPAKQVDVLLYDTFAHENALAAVIAAARAKRVVVYTWSRSDAYVAEVLAGGASGYLEKSLGAGEIVTALERVHAGEIVVDVGPRLAVLPRGEDWPGRLEGLSAREGEVIAWIAAGHSNQEVADRAYLSINTVKTYIRSAYRKMEVTSRSQAVLWAVDHDFRPAPPTSASR